MTYWQRYSLGRVSRRRALAGMSMAAAASALYLSGCGGDDGDSGSSGSSLVLKPVDTTDQAKTGGVFKDSVPADVPSFDIYGNSVTTTQGFGRYTYPRLLKFKLFKYPERPDSSVEGDIVESFEISPDKLSITMKLRPGLKWDPRAPTSGRVIDAEDIVFAWNRYAAVSPFSADVAHIRSPEAPVESAVAVDSRTVTFKMAQEDSAITILFANGRTLNVMPRESDGGFDPKGTVRGYGPWLLEEYTPSTRLVWMRAPEYYIKGRPFFDKIEVPIIPEYATRHAQFRSGNIHVAGETVVRLEDIVRTKQEVPELLLRQGGQFGDGGVHEYIAFDYEPGSPFRDIRVRQAAGMLLDRDGYEDIITARSSFSAVGIDIPTRWVTWIPTNQEGYWLDPRGKDFGPDAKYFKYDPAEAKKLLSAAGHANGFETKFTFQVNRDFAYDKFGVIIPEMLTQGGIKCESVPVDNRQYSATVLRAYAQGSTKGEPGVRLATMPTIPTLYLGMFAAAHPQGRNFVGMQPQGSNENASKGDPEITALVEKMKLEFDVAKQQAIAQEFQRQMARKAYAPNLLIDSPLFTMAWPAVGNYGVYESVGPATTESDLTLWLDQTKPPFKRT